MDSKNKNTKEYGLKNEANGELSKRKKALELINLWIKELEERNPEQTNKGERNNDK